MFALRVYHTRDIHYIFLVWNTFLAWLPWLFVAFAWRWQQRRWFALPYLGLWLLFIPNAPYLITDLIHLRPHHNVPLWYDALLLFTFALIGLVLALTSLSLVHTIITRYYGQFIGWSSVVAACGLTGLGVTIGRLLRWNSWDLFWQPWRLVQTVLDSLLSPATFDQSLGMTAFFAALLLVTYLLWQFSPSQLAYVLRHDVATRR